MECDFRYCPGGHYKHDSCLSQALYEVAHSSADEQCGSSDFGWMALFLVEQDWTVKANEWSGDADLHIPAGTYVTLYAAESGKVTLYEYDSATDASNDYDAFEKRLGEWLEANEW